MKVNFIPERILLNLYHLDLIPCLCGQVSCYLVMMFESQFYTGRHVGGLYELCYICVAHVHKSAWYANVINTSDCWFFWSLPGSEVK
jgi:hypothetical protein